MTQQDKKYIVVKETFQCLGYPSLEEECAERGGFLEEDEILSSQEERCFQVLEMVCDKIFKGFFFINNLRPERRIIFVSKEKENRRSGFGEYKRKSKKVLIDDWFSRKFVQ